MQNSYELPRNKMATALFPMGSQRSACIAEMEGGARLRKDGCTSFPDSPRNLALALRYFPQIKVQLPAPVGAKPLQTQAKGVYCPKTEPFGPYQQEAYDLCKDKDYFALFMETGTGKTKVAIDATGWQFAQGWITGVLVITIKGVHAQWVGQAPGSPLRLHLGTINGQPLPHTAQAWQGRPAPLAGPYNPNVLEIFAVNFEALRSKEGKKAVLAFIARHEGTLRTIVDESHKIANYSSQQTENCIAIGGRSRTRLIMSGTPVPKSPEDEWTQSLFLSEEIFGHRYVTTFRREYARLDRKGDVLEWRNIDKFRSIVRPHVFRILKHDAIGLPKKVYDSFYFDLEPKQRQHYNELKRNFLTQIQQEIVTVQNAAVLLMRLQQITCGVLIDEDGTIFQLENPRIFALAQLLEKFAEQNKIIIWARFKRDIWEIETLLKTLSNAPIGKLVGGQTTVERRSVVEQWTADPSMRFIVGNPAAGGTGTDGLQYGCSTVIYYSNGFNSVDRWQSEDRTNRIGSSTTESVLYVDLIANQTVDAHILNNLQRKKDMAEFVLGDFAQILMD